VVSRRIDGPASFVLGLLVSVPIKVSFMATASQPSPRPAEVPELHSGDRMTREEFHRIYERMRKDFRAELIGGIVYVSSPLKRRHGTGHITLGGLFSVYEQHIPGVEAGDNATVFLSEDDEPQPDLFLRILPEYGGQSRTTEDDYVEGAPELLSEIANSSRSIDLNAKRKEYAQHGVLEYLVYCVKEKQLRWFDLHTNKELKIDADGICRVRGFPGLWINVKALIAKSKQLHETLLEGLASAEHAAFVKELASRKS
jgi:Uma2 family endonuclease